MTFSCYHSSERLYPWGLFGGDEGTLSSFQVKAPGDSGYQNFKERYGVRCAGKFTNVHLPEGAMLKLTVGGGGGYGKPASATNDPIAVDLLEGFYDEEYDAEKLSGADRRGARASQRTSRRAAGAFGSGDDEP